MAKKPKEIEREIRAEYQKKYASEKESWNETKRNKRPGFYHFTYQTDPDSQLAKDAREDEMNAKIQLALNLNNLNLPLDGKMWEIMEVTASRRGSVMCPFCEEIFKPFSDHMDSSREVDVAQDLGLDREEEKASIDRFGDPFFRLKMHLILLHDNPSEIDVDRTKEVFWKDVMGFIDVESRVSNRVFLWEIMRIWRELGESRKKKGV